MPDLTQQRQAEGVITKTQPTGPNTDLLGNPFKYEIHRFPPNVGMNNRLLHWIKFTPCIQEKSSYQVTTTGLSSADINRSGTAGIQGANGGFTGLESGFIAGGLALLSTAEGAADYLAADTPGEKAEAKGDIKKGLFGAAASGVIVSAIKLGRKTRRSAASICLYMPDTINQQLVNDYDQVSLTQALGKAGLIGQAGGAIADGVGEALKSGDLKSFGLGGGGTAAGGLAEVGGMIAEKTGNFGAGIADVLMFSAGIAQNPQVELLFKSIQNREFLFDYKFVPRNKKEAESIISIIQEFRFHAAPEIPEGSSGRYFIPPSEFDIEFMLGGNRNPKLPKISTCVLQGIDVNYGSAGQWTAFEDGMPVEISLQLRFKEVEIMHKKLIKDGY
jgi:hypothetical protein